MNTHLNQSIVSQIQINYEQQPIAVFLLGANGCGKSSLRHYLNLSDIQTNIDPDQLNRIARLRARGDVLIHASRQAISLFEHALKHHLNVCIESTFSGYSAMSRLKRAKAQGYYTLVYFVGLDDVELNLKRIAHRVLMGGHDIPEPLVRKRFTQSIDNLITCEAEIDELHVLDNSGRYYEPQFSRYPNQKFLHYDETERWALSVYKKLSQIHH